MSDQSTSRVAVIAGGGSGIGRCCARRLAALNYDLVLVGRNRDKLESVAGELADSGCNVLPFPADVRDWDRIAELGEQLSTAGIDLLVNSAGGQFAKPSATLSQNGWQSVVDVNLSGAFFLCRHLFPALKVRRGAIVNVVADIWRRPAPMIAHSAAARAGVVSLTRTLAMEWAAEGIRVNAVSPGLTDTEALHDRYLHLVERVPLGRMGTADEVVDAILFLASASYVTGEVLTVDGGLNLA